MGYSPVRLARQAIGLGPGDREPLAARLFGKRARRRRRACWKSRPRSQTRPTSGSANRSRRSTPGVAQMRHRVAPPRGAARSGARRRSTRKTPSFLATPAPSRSIEVCRIFRLAPHKVGDFFSSPIWPISNHRTFDHLMTTLMPWCMAEEQEYKPQAPHRAGAGPQGLLLRATRSGTVAPRRSANPAPSSTDSSATWACSTPET